MCGIVGFIDKNNSTAIVENMLKVQAYRGPDDNGTYFDGDSGVHFGHNRLSIQDLSSHGHQPFISSCGEYIIAFNGEVYNFKEIREDLKALGYQFISNSDTEVILYSYKAWGMKCLEKFIGMFAFAILDKSIDKLYLVRDRAGVKPLYYYQYDDQFIFSSEIKSFHQHPEFKKEQNLEVLPYYFQFGYIPAPYTIFENCFKLESGHYLEFNLKDSTFEIYHYWDVNDFYKQEKNLKSEDEILSELETILNDSIALRMVSDVPVGVFLSGGYDSSLVTSILAKKQNKKINTFTIGFDDERYNEAEHAKIIANYLGTNHTEYYMNNNDMVELIEKLPFYYDEPFGANSSLATIILSKLAKQSVTVALSADGGDEAFCGYSKYIFLNKFQNIFSSNFKKKGLQILLNSLNEESVESINNKLPKSMKQTNIKDKFSKFKRAINSKTLEEMFENASSYIDKNDVKNFLQVPYSSSVFNKWSKIDNLEFMNQMMAIDYKLFMSDEVLVKVDKATMSASLEGREPLIDHRIIEFMATIPLDIKYKNGKSKYLLRKLLYKYLPKEIVDKPKSGFQVPLNTLLRNELKYLVNNYINEKQLSEKIFNVNLIIKMKKEFFNGKENGNIIWLILVYQMWCEKWMDS